MVGRWIIGLWLIGLWLIGLWETAGTWLMSVSPLPRNSKVAVWRGPWELPAPALAVFVAMSAACNHTPPSALPPPQSTQAAPMFREVTKDRGLNFQHDAGPTGDFFFPQIMGAGCALFDFDGDGDLDVYLINGGDFSSPPSESETPTGAANQLFRQEANGRFVDVSVEVGLDDHGYGMGIAIGDVDNDGDPDVYLTNYGADQLYLNESAGRFVRAAPDAGIANLRWSASACFVDYDRDGWLDLFVTNYVDWIPRLCVATGGGDQDFCAPHMFPATSDRLFHNETGRQPASSERQAVFREVSLEAGIAATQGPGLGVLAADFNEDGWPDLYVANDQTSNVLWINQRDGTFRDEAVLRGCANDTQGRSQAGMGVALGDVNGDTFLDLFVTHLDGEANALYLADAVGFRESSGHTGLAQGSFPMTGFGTALADLDLDGTLDLAVVNGRVRRSPSSDETSGVSDPQSGRFWSAYAQPNQLLMNNGGGGFREFTSATDPFLKPRAVSRGLASGDIDNDGDIDLLVSNVAGRARLYINQARPRGSWLTVRAVAPQWGGRDAQGAVVRVQSGTRTWQSMVQRAGSYLSSSDPRAHFGLGDARHVDNIEIIWPDGTREAFAGGPVNRLIVLSHGTGQTH